MSFTMTENFVYQVNQHNNNKSDVMQDLLLGENRNESKRLNSS